MSITQQALWILERNLTQSLNLDEVAKACGVTHFHLAHAFARRTGQPLVRYLRTRRLTMAACALVGRNVGILDLALESGYASHEAFTRAFKAQFNATPKSVRIAGSTDHLKLTHPISLDLPDSEAESAPTRAQAAGFIAVGIWGRLGVGEASVAAELWQSFMAQAHHLVAQSREPPIGIGRTTPDSDAVDYACAVIVDKGTRIPKGLSRIEVPARDYAVFPHKGHVCTIGATYAAIWDGRLPASGLRIEEHGMCLERHRDTFDPTTGLGGVDIWMPLPASERFTGRSEVAKRCMKSPRL
jgi:AraC family transcriptional regulator